MRTLINKQIWKILELFYKNRNVPLHLRDIARKIQLREGAASRHLNSLVAKEVLKVKSDGNLKKFCVAESMIPKIFPLYDSDRFEKLPSICRSALSYYIAALTEKPVFILLFGSAAKGMQKKDSDIDIIEVYNKKTNSSAAITHAGSQTGMKISSFQMTLKQFMTEIKLKEDYVIQAGIETGFPIFNAKYYYEVLNEPFNPRPP